MEPNDTTAHALADVVLLLLVLVLAIVAAVSPVSVIVIGVPLLAAHQLRATRRSRAS